MIIWRGKGFLVLIIICAAMLLVSWLANGISGDPDFYKNNAWPQICTIIIASACIYFVGRWINRKTVHKYIDEETGEEREEAIDQNIHTFFYVRFEYWAFITPVLGALAIFVL